MARQIVVDIIGDSSRFSGAVDQASNRAGGLTNVMRGVGLGIGAAGFNMVTNAVGGMVDALGEADAAYQEDMRSQGLLTTALEANVEGFDGRTEAIEEVIAAQMRLGFGDEEQRDSLGNLVGITHDVTEAQKLQATAMDLARLKGMDLSTASDLVGKVYAGNMGTLSRYGIVLEENATREEALAAIQALAGGQAEAYAAGPLGTQEAAQLRVGESMERIGSIVNQVSSVALPILADAFANVVDWLMNTWEAIEPGVQQLVRDLTPAFNNVVTVLGVIAGVIGNVVRAVLPPLWTAINILGTIWGEVFGRIWGTVSTVVGNVRGAFDGIVGFITGLPNRIGRAASGMWDGIWRAFKGAINGIIRGWNSLQFTLPSVDLGPLGRVGGFTVGVPDIPLLHAGGIVPGVPGSDVAAILQAGERVIPRSQAGGGITINIENFTGSDSDIDRLADRLAMRLRLQGV